MPAKLARGMAGTRQERSVDRPQEAVRAQFVRIRVDRKEDPCDATDETVARDEADVGNAAIARVVAIVAEDEVASRRYGDLLRVVENAVLLDIEGAVANAVRQRLDIAAGAGRCFRDRTVWARLPVDELAVEDQPAFDHLHAIAGEADDALGVDGQV